MATALAGWELEDIVDFVSEPELEFKARKILLLLAAEAGSQDFVVTSERKLSQWTGYSRSVIWQRLHQLEETGWIEADRTPGIPTCISLRLPGGWSR